MSSDSRSTSQSRATRHKAAHGRPQLVAVAVADEAGWGRRSPDVDAEERDRLTRRRPAGGARGGAPAVEEADGSAAGRKSYDVGGGRRPGGWAEELRRWSGSG